jgi:hypothetical protein
VVRRRAMSRDHHHVVSRGYQTAFAPDGRVCMVDKQSKHGRLIGIGDAFTKKHFSSYVQNGSRTDEIEDEWGRIENDVIPHVRRALAGARDDYAREATKELAAVHFARSYMFEEKLLRLAQQNIDELAPGLGQKPEVRAAFVREHEREPSEGEIEQMARRS